MLRCGTLCFFWFHCPLKLSYSYGMCLSTLADWLLVPIYAHARFTFSSPARVLRVFYACFYACFMRAFCACFAWGSRIGPAQPSASCRQLLIARRAYSSSSSPLSIAAAPPPPPPLLPPPPPWACRGHAVGALGSCLVRVLGRAGRGVCVCVWGGGGGAP